MKAPVTPDNEAERLQALRESSLLDTPAETRFDTLTRLAKQMFQCEIALISLVDAERQWFKSRQGLDACETGRDISFCGHAILSDDTFYVPDASLDPRFRDNPLVLGPPNIRFYAGAPIRTMDGYRIGTLCVIDSRPRELSAADFTALRDLGDCVEREIGVHRQQHRQDALLTLTKITALSSGSAQAALRDALKLGCEYLGLPFGIISRVQGNVYQVQVQVSPPDTLTDGQEFSLDNTYCSLTLDSEDVLAIPHMGDSTQAGHPCYREFGLESYIGIPLEIEGKVYGTLNFSSPEPRDPPIYSDADIEFVRLLGGWVANRLQRWKLDQTLQQHQALNDAIARAQSQFIRGTDRGRGFDTLLQDALKLTGSEYGFIGEVLYTADNAPYLKTYAISNIAWDDATNAFYRENAPKGMEFLNLDTLFGAALTSQEPVICNAPANDPRSGGLPDGHPPLNAFLGLPINYGGEMVAMIGMANREEGYDKDVIQFLHPLLTSIGQLVEATRNQERRQNSELRLRALFELSPVGIALNDYATGSFLDVNDALLSPAGYTRDEFMALRFWDVTPKEYEAQEAAQLKLLEECGRYGPYEKEYIRKDGSRYPVLLNGVLVEDLSGSRLIWSIVEDISERKKMDQMKNEFVSTVSHELRTPLTSISGALGLLEGGIAGEFSEQVKDLISIACRNSERLSNLINDLLDIEKLAAGKLHFDMRSQLLMPLLDQALEANRAYGAERRVTLAMGEVLPDARVRVDSTRFMQVMSNLLSNAVKYSPEDGVVDVLIDRHGNWVRVTVMDHGLGVPEEFQSRIFQKFAQADSSDTRLKGGTGLGLAITKELVERMGGRIDFESAAGEGAKFYFELPLLGENP